MAGNGVDPRRLYSGAIGRTRPLAARFGLLSAAERRRSKRVHDPVAHLGSLFHVFDIDEMVRADTPWWTYRAAEVVDAFLQGRRQARVFEFGAGASTIWLARRAAHVDSVEHDVEYAQVVRAVLDREGLTERVQLHEVVPLPVDGAARPITSDKPGAGGLDFRPYVETIDRVAGEAGTRYDLIVVDGRARQSCLAAALRHLADDGIVLFDDSYRPRYRAAIKNSGLRERSHAGFVPSLPNPSATSLLTRA